MCHRGTNTHKKGWKKGGKTQSSLENKIPGQEDSHFVIEKHIKTQKNKSLHKDQKKKPGREDSHTLSYRDTYTPSALYFCFFLVFNFCHTGKHARPRRCISVLVFVPVCSIFFHMHALFLSLYCCGIGHVHRDSA